MQRVQSGHRAGPDQIEPNSDADTKAMHTQHYMKGGAEGTWKRWARGSTFHGHKYGCKQTFGAAYVTNSSKLRKQA